MKKGFLVILILCLFCPVFSQSVPERVYGIWEGKDRIVFFEENQSNENPELFVVLKDFYGWYYDRAAESDSYSKKEPRTRNDATPKKAENIPFTIQSNENYNTYYITVNYTRRDSFIIPLAMLGDNLFLNFLTRDLDFSDEQQLEIAKTSYDGFYRGNLVSEGITISNQKVQENITGFYILEDKLYNIRYWKTDMDYSSEYATFTYGEDSFQVPCHIQAGGYNYSCVSGRSRRVRNPQPSIKFNPEDYLFDENHTVLILDKTIYLTKMADKSTFEDLIQIIKKNNSRRHPPVQPVFEDLNLDYHWDLIDALEKENTLIQAVRERQKALGPRGKDINN